MKSPSPRERQELAILSAIEIKPLAMADLQEILGDAHFVFDDGDTERLIGAMAADGSVTTWPIPGREHGGLVAVQIAESGRLRLADLRESRPDENAEPLTDRVNRFLDSYCPKEKAGSVAACEPHEPAEEREETAAVCLTRGALEAWWDSLTVDAKAEALASHYETAALATERVHLAAQGRAALDSRRMHEVTA